MPRAFWLELGVVAKIAEVEGELSQFDADSGEFDDQGDSENYLGRSLIFALSQPYKWSASLLLELWSISNRYVDLIDWERHDWGFVFADDLGMPPQPLTSGLVGKVFHLERFIAALNNGDLSVSPDALQALAMVWSQSRTLILSQEKAFPRQYACIAGFVQVVDFLQHHVRLSKVSLVNSPQPEVVIKAFELEFDSAAAPVTGLGYITRADIWGKKVPTVKDSTPVFGGMKIFRTSSRSGFVAEYVQVEPENGDLVLLYNANLMPLLAMARTIPSASASGYPSVWLDMLGDRPKMIFTDIESGERPLIVFSGKDGVQVLASAEDYFRLGRIIKLSLGQVRLSAVLEDTGKVIRYQGKVFA